MMAKVYSGSLYYMIYQCPHDKMNDKFLDRKVVPHYKAFWGVKEALPHNDMVFKDCWGYRQ